jgi:hypothetical protein
MKRGEGRRINAEYAEKELIDAIKTAMGSWEDYIKKIESSQDVS